MEEDNLEFDLSKYNETIDAFTDKDIALQKLVDNRKKARELERERKLICLLLSNPEQATKLEEAVSKAHEGILDCDTTDIEKVLMVSFEDNPELYDFLIENKHKPFFKSGEVFDKFDSHEVQKRMKRSKMINRRTIKKSKTANQHIQTLWTSKATYLKDLDFAKMKSTLCRLELQQKITEMKISDLSSDLSLLASKVKDTKQLIAYKVYMDNRANFSYTDIAKMLDIPEGTLRRWVSKVKELL